MTTYFYDAFGPGFDPEQEKDGFQLGRSFLKRNVEGWGGGTLGSDVTLNS